MHALVRCLAPACLWIGTATLALAQGLNTIPVELETQGVGGFSTLAAALKATQLNTALAGPGPFTIFAPTNKAFADQFPQGLPQDRARLTRILTYHVVPGRLTSFNFRPGQQTELKTLEGSTLQITVGPGGAVRVNGANVVVADVPVANGVIHGIDAVLIP